MAVTSTQRVLARSQSVGVWLATLLELLGEEVTAALTTAAAAAGPSPPSPFLEIDGLLGGVLLFALTRHYSIISVIMPMWRVSCTLPDDCYPPGTTCSWLRAGGPRYAGAHT